METHFYLSEETAQKNGGPCKACTSEGAIVEFTTLYSRPFFARPRKNKGDVVGCTEGKFVIIASGGKPTKFDESWFDDFTPEQTEAIVSKIRTLPKSEQPIGFDRNNAPVTTIAIDVYAGIEDDLTNPICRKPAQNMPGDVQKKIGGRWVLVNQCG
ncbi:MAG: hypothetical protein HGA90_00900 [Alphaproteobacteria bacterium]|nr:hypothetical protein [Alphaproteobacteria bacterium]